MAHVLCLTSLLEGESFVSRDVACIKEENEALVEDIETDDELVYPTSKFSPKIMPQKNTFIHYNIPGSPTRSPPPIPTCSAPSILLRRFFKSKTEDGSLSDAETAATELPIRSLSSERSMILATSGDTAERMTSYSGTMAMHASPSGYSANAASLSQTGFVTNANPVVQEMHILRQCTPCNYFWHKADGCRQGANCTFCHLCTKGEIKKRKKDKLRDLRKAGLVRRRR